MARELDYDLLALKFQLIAPEKFATIREWSGSDYELEIANGTEVPWEFWYQHVQEQLGVFPLTAEEGNQMRNACWRLMGVTRDK